MKRSLAAMALMFVCASSAAAGYTDNNDGTIADASTGLMWQKCSAGQDALDCTGTAGGYTWDNAIGYCEGLVLGGHSDWRLPNIKELRSIVDSTAINPAISTIYFPNTPFASYPYFWSSTTRQYSTQATAWTVNFSDGSTYEGWSKGGAFLVRCVR